MPSGDRFERVEVRSRLEWRNWLIVNCERTESVWLVTFKAHHPDHVSYDDAIEEALCFGWIDSVPRKLDGDRSMVLMSPRKVTSVWSALNKRRVAAMQAAGPDYRSGALARERGEAKRNVELSR